MFIFKIVYHYFLGGNAYLYIVQNRFNSNDELYVRFSNGNTIWGELVVKKWIDATLYFFQISGSIVTYVLVAIQFELGGQDEGDL